ncbi:MAG: hypothetical protein WED33_10450 [Bacteroidia bacterium]
MIRLILFFLILASFSSCDRTGCTDPNAANYEEKVESDDGSCRYDSDPFEGRWEVRDSLLDFGDYYAQPLKTLDIRVESLNRSKVKFFFRFEDGSYSDTLEANAKPNTLSIPEQTYGDTLVFQGNFTIARIGGIKVDYRISNDNVYLEYRGIGTEL